MGNPSQSSSHYGLVSAVAIGMVSLVLISVSFAATDERTSKLLLEDLKYDLDKALLMGSRPYNENGTRREFKKRATTYFDDDSFALASTQEMILAAGFEYKSYKVLSPDGYITEILRIINPQVDMKYLKRPPIMVMHGGITDTSIFVWVDIKKHHPEIYPRNSYTDPPITSSNRSMLFLLANHGYDVWLCGTRGANQFNQGHVKYDLKEATDTGNLDVQLKYWKFTMDDVVKYEIPAQMDLILKETRSEKLTYMVVSLSTPMAFMFFASNPTYTKKISCHVNWTPILNDKTSNNFIRTLYRKFCINLSLKQGVQLWNDLIFSNITREVLGRLSKSREVTYTLIKYITVLITGSSPKYQTDLDPPVAGHTLEQLGFNLMKQFCQMNVAGRYQKFDYGKKVNLVLYGSETPPIYDISDTLLTKNWLMLSAGNDVLGTPDSALEIIERINHKPLKHIFVKHFSHLDVYASFENDLYVNLPTLDFVEEFCHSPQGYDDSISYIPQVQVQNSFGFL